MTRRISKVKRGISSLENSSCTQHPHQCTLQEIISCLPNSSLLPIDTGDVIITRVVEDSRAVTIDTLFVASSKQNLDGHMFVRRAVANGATAVVILSERELEFSNLPVPRILVEDMNNIQHHISKLCGDMFVEMPSHSAILASEVNSIDSAKTDAHSADLLPFVVRPASITETHYIDSSSTSQFWSPLVLAILLASFTVTLLCYYVTAYAHMNADEERLSRLRHDLKLAVRREIALRSEISRYTLSINSQAQVMGLMPVSPESVTILDISNNTGEKNGKADRYRQIK